MVRARKRATENHLQILTENRTRLLEAATEHAIRWLGIQNVEGRSPETRWLAGFTNSQDVSGDLISAHKVAWSIQGVAGRPYDAMARAVQETIRQRPNPHLPVAEARDWVAARISKLASDLGELAVAGMRPGKNGKKRTARHTSWASKILHHAWPDARTFVWDTNARLSLNTRLRHTLSDNAPRGYDYRKFLDECEMDLHSLRNCVEFQVGLDHLIQTRGSILKTHCQNFAELSESEHNAMIVSFLERRLHDKYLWVEGELIRNKII